MKLLLTLGFILSYALIGMAQQSAAGELMNSYFEKRAEFLSSSTKKISAENQAELDAIVTKLKEADPESFEYNLVYYVNGNYNTSREENLFKAYALNGSNERVVSEMLAYYMVTFNTGKQTEFVKKVQSYYTPAELNYYQDALPDENGILFTSSHEDMFGFLVAQQVKGSGTGVQLFCLDFMKNDEYRAYVSNNLGISDMSFLGNEKAYLKSALTSSSESVFISITVPQNYLSSVSSQMYISGLYYEYGASGQYQKLSQFWTDIKSKDMSNVVLTKSAEKKLYANYLPPLLTLYMMQPGDQLLKTTIQAIATKVGRDVEVNEILKEIDAN